MVQEILTQKQFLDMYNSGRREFSNITLQHFDIVNADFSGVTIKDSKLLFGVFRNCDMENVRFENCEFFYAGFYNAKMVNTEFEKCRIEISVFEHMQFEGVKLAHCYLHAVGILWSNHASLDMSTSAQHVVITDTSQLTQQDMENVISGILDYVARQDISVRMEVKRSIQRQIERYNLKEPKKDGYESKGEGYKDRPLTYGEVRALVEAVFGAYGQQAGYKTRKPYEAKGKYK